MPTRRDQLQSYQFAVQRVLSAFAYHDTDPERPAGRRQFSVGMAGVLVAVLVAAGIGVFALLKPGGKSNWRDGQSIIIERETGTRFIFRGAVLYPMANYASAELALGGPASTTRVSASSLRGVPRGPLLGIVGAPDSLPSHKRVLGAPWTVCVRPSPGGGPAATTTTLRVGRPAAGGHDLGADALLARAVDTGQVYLVWNRYRYEITDQRAVFAAFGMDDQAQTVVDEAWLNTLPEGPALAPDPPPGPGTASAAVDGARIGQVYVVSAAGADRQYFVVADAQRLAPITQVAANLLLADPAIATAYPGQAPRALPLGLAQEAAADKVVPPAPSADAPPATVPRIAPSTAPGAGVCAEFTGATDPPRLVVDVPAGPSVASGATTGRTVDGEALADRVDVEPGWAAVVEAMPSPGAGAGTRFLVTDLGVRYALAGAAEQQALGFGDVTPVRMPAGLVARIPAGPALDPRAANRLVPG
ncbi:MAG: type VII secretion protein EccB [Frankia sp.]